jgi:drug/metabolite transporter (DMT)-like permease
MDRKAYILLLLTTLFWGGNNVAGKLAVGHVSPMLLTCSRWALACAILLAFGWPRLKADWPVIRSRLPYLFAMSAAGFAVYNLALYAALLYTTAINASIEQAGMPMLIFIANFLLFRLRVSWAQILAFVISIAGVALTAAHGDPTRLLELDVNFGDALILLSIIVYSGYTVALRFRPQVHWMSLMIVLTGGAALASLPFAMGEFAYGAGIAPDLQGWAVIIYAVLFPSLLSQVFFIRAVEYIGANRAGLFINLVPIFGTLLSVLVLRETFHLYHAIAMAMVLGGIALAEASGRRTPD